MVWQALISLFETIIGMFQSGGIITYIITLIGIYGILTSMQNIFYLRKISKEGDDEIMGIVNDSMHRGGAIEALKSISQMESPAAKIIAEALKIGYKNRVEVQESMERVFIYEYDKLTKDLESIKTIIEIAPFLGLLGTVIGIWQTFKALGVNGDPLIMSKGIYTALITTIAGLTVAIILLPALSIIKVGIEKEMDKIELSTKMSNWSYGVMRLKVNENLEDALEALHESEGIISVKEIDDPEANIQISFKPSTLEKSINNIILENCDTHVEVIESKLRA